MAAALLRSVKCNFPKCNFPAKLRGNQTFEPIEHPWQAIRTWIPADGDESPTDTPELWDQTTGTGWKPPETDPGDGRTPVLEYT
jgi:hypothetical protein